jgi:hypothetical protein
MVRFVLFFSLSFLAVSVNAQNLSQKYLDKELWANFDWRNADKTSLWVDDKFQPNKSDITEDGQRFHHYQSIDIDGRSYNVSLVSNTRKIENSEYTTLSLKDVKEGDCETVKNRWSQVFGGDSGMINNSYYLITKGYPLIEMAYQWEAGKTRITLECGNISANDGLRYISFKYEFAEFENKMRALIHLTCSRKYSISGSQNGQWANAQSLAITVIPAKKVITDSDLIRLGDLKAISDSYIDFSISANNLNLNYQISRIDGTLTGSALDKKTGVSQARIEGSCETRVPSARKF